MAIDSWTPTNAFRQSVVSKIDEAIHQSGVNTSKNSNEMENHVFQKAKNKEEYLGYTARLILHIREMKSKQGGMPPNGTQMTNNQLNNQTPNQMQTQLSNKLQNLKF